MKYNIKTYKSEYQSLWDDFIDRSANGTFTHKRAYMDYHADRFQDFSLMIFEGEKLKAVLPAHRSEKELFAHQGLTYSDFIYHFKLKLEAKVEILQTCLQFLSQAGIEELHIKSIPFVFHKLIDQSNAYLYFQIEACVEVVKPFFVRIKSNEIKANRNRKKNIRKMSGRAYQIEENPERLTEFWRIVEQNLQERYQSTPVHSLEEMQLLMNRFPAEIKLYTLVQNKQVLAGALVYYINSAMHFQYIHAVTGTEEREAVEWLVFQVVELNSQMEYISFGTSAVEGNNLHKGLVYWKQSFGSSLINQYYYKISTRNYNLLKNILQ